MTTRLEARFGVDAAVGTSYVQLGSDAPNDRNVLLNIVNLLTATVKLRAYIADGSWTSGDGEPTSGNGKLIVPIAYDIPIAVGDVVQISGIIVEAGEALIVRADTAAGLAISAHGVDIT